MTTRVKQYDAVTANTDLREFTADFFEFFDAKVSKLENRKNGVLHVVLGEDLADHFGKPELSLTFHNAADSAGYDLVAHGSRAFDRMLTYLERRSALTVQNLPSRFPSSEELLQAIRPVNASIASLRMQEPLQRLFVFNWRITYRADDKREELYAVVLDENGLRLPLLGETAEPDEGLDLESLFSDAIPAPVEMNEDGQPLPPKLPPMTQLVQLAEAARKYAIYHADLRCVNHEAEILPRLYQTLNRLTTYYGQQIQEVYEAHDPTGEKRRILETDLERKLAEEVENHRLRVQVVLFSYAVLQTPVAVANIVLSDGRREAPIQVLRNRYTGAIQRPVCHACGQETTIVALDHNGHITCDDCLRQCATCQDVLCAECGVEPCPVCGRENCDTCGDFCWACGGRACHEHISACLVCGDMVCHACQAECGCCGVRQCRSHLRLDSVLSADGSGRLICAECAVRCPGCQQYSAAIDTCSASGQRFCTNCLVTCAKCGSLFGPGYYQIYSVDGKPYCANCLKECPVCHALTPDVIACNTCGATYCYRCGLVCDVCQQHCCDDHAHTYPDCGHVVCSKHVVTCGVDGEEICAVCNEVCGICERYFCADHAATCRRCGCTYCRECVRISGLCDTCAGIDHEGEPVKLGDDLCAADPVVAALAPQYHWLCVANHRYAIYLGQGMLMSGAIVVVEKTEAGPRIVSAHKMKFIDSIRDKFMR